MNKLQPIQTHYAGHHFRSRLEARWAVFFNTAGITWDYEPEGYALPSGRYLPDFWLPEQNTWLEVKGPWDPRGMMLSAELADATGHPCIWAEGPIPKDANQEIIEWIGRDPEGDLNWVQPWRTLTQIFAMPNLDDALHTARCARFEHGETPR